MTDYTEATLRGATVRLSDGSTVEAVFNPAGTNGWLNDVIVAWTDHDDYMTWNINGQALCAGDPDIVEVL
jgi:hypothetical protein